MFKVTVKNEEETMRFAERLGKKLDKKVVVAFFGGLGMGKTTFTKGLAKGLGVTDEVSSPTFALVHEYRGKKTLYHFDMYRVETWDDLYQTGFFDYYEQGGILAVEWSENIDAALPQGTIRIHIEPGEHEEDRVITAQADTLPPGWKE